MEEQPTTRPEWGAGASHNAVAEEFAAESHAGVVPLSRNHRRGL
jgi:hypothetical protein